MTKQATDLTAATRDALDALRTDLPRLATWLRACHDAMYADLHRVPDLIHPPDEPSERIRRCGACEHPDENHDEHGCDLDECGCRRLEPYPSTVGWAHWTGPGKAEKAYVAATKHLQRANDAIGKVERVPAHWVSDALHRPGPVAVPMRLELVLHGVRLLRVACRHVEPDACAPPESSAVMEARDEIGAAIGRLVRAQDPLDDDERRELARPRCIRGDGIAAYAKGLCRNCYARASRVG